MLRYEEKIEIESVLFKTCNFSHNKNSKFHRLLSQLVAQNSTAKKMDFL